ncbi:hypothetical protein ACFP2T_16480 [Plantactinospora solaniradicis]|uniref:Uncharacterized protein n=1 Tax=Plantactinospora solaniradicis TaxID=1723736 RepID=A0ABW1K9X9_9ACTN
MTWTPAAVSSSDTIASSILGTLGAYLVVINAGGSPDNVTVSDSGFTPAANPASTSANAVANGTTEVMYISPKAVNPSTGVVTVTHSFTTSVTYVLLPLG